MLAPGTRLGRYAVVAPLGAGGMGEVYRARDARLDREVAIKVLAAGAAGDRRQMKRFEQEARAAGSLNHPNILAVYDVGRHEGAPYLVTELLEGETLRERMRRPIETRDAVDYALQAAYGLAAAHEKGIVHRDVKPENLFVRSDGFVKILDFGIAMLDATSIEARGSEDATLVNIETEPGAVVGTILYMSPEQVRGQRVDARSDLFSLGAVLYEMLTGRPPFHGPTGGDIIVAILEKRPAPLSRARTGLPRDLGKIVRRLLRKPAEERFQAAVEIAEGLEEVKRRLDGDAALRRSVRSSAARKAATATSTPPPAKPKAKPPAQPTAKPTAQPRREAKREPIDSLAVLPLANASDDKAAEYLSDGITEAIINDLVGLPKLRVVSRATVFRYKGRDVDPLEVARELDVRAVLTGRLVVFDDTLVVKVELVETTTDAQLWGAQHARPLADIFALEEEIAREICEQLKLTLTRAERRRIAKRYTENTEAYHLYLKGRHCLNKKRTPKWLRRGIAFFQQAIDHDSNYALAYAGIADAYGLLASSSGGLPPTECYPKAKAAAERALDIDEELGEAHTSLGFFRLLYDWDYAAAEVSFLRGVELNPNYAPAHDGFGFVCKVTGRFEEAIAACKRALEVDPLSLFHTCSLGWAYYFARRYDEAIECGTKALEMDPSFAVAYWHLGLAHEQAGRYGKAIEAFRQGVALSERGLMYLAHLGRASALAGRPVEAQLALDELHQKEKGRYISPYFFAIVHLGLGEVDRAMEWLERAYVERSGFLAFLGVEPMFDAVRGDARFVELTRRVGIAPVAATVLTRKR
jgi:serine/threonine protein kinase/tetratricopeptide (TPR) repeat protein